jgi:hypothetical protein
LDALIDLGTDWLAAARLAATLVIGYLALIWLATVIWTYRDISSRTRDPISQAVMVGIVVVLPILGLPIYMALRPPETLQHAYDREIEQEAILADIQTTAACPSCRRPTDAGFRVCAYCGTSLKEPCRSCGELLMHAWRYCPHCATPRAVAPLPATVGAPPRLDFSTGDDAYEDIPERPAAPAAAAPAAGIGSTGAPRSATPLARGRRPVARIGGSADPEAAPQPRPARRPATEE